MSVALNPALLPPVAIGAGEPVSPARSGAVGPVRAPATGAPSARPVGQTDGTPFATVLDGANHAEATSAVGLHFSKHALQRVQRRGIDVSPPTLARLADGVGRAAQKGSRDSIVLVDGTAFVVSVPSRTVVTAVGSAHMRDHVFTNIDSAVIA